MSKETNYLSSFSSQLDLLEAEGRHMELSNDILSMMMKNVDLSPLAGKIIKLLAVPYPPSKKVMYAFLTRKMQFIALLLCVVCATTSNGLILGDLDQHWADYKRVFGKEYNEPEEATRRAIWQQRVDDIAMHNLGADLGLRSYRVGLNAFSDQERRGSQYILPGQPRNVSFFIPPAQQLPDAVDWREKGAVTPVRNQGECGAPWSFSATGALEGQNQRKTGRLVVLSVQNLIDCVTSSGGGGCTGSDVDMNAAFYYVMKNGGIDTEASYPTTGQEGKCRFQKEGIGATCSGYAELPIGDEEVLKQIVATAGPVSTFIDASHISFQMYISGIYDEPQCSSEMLDHAVLIVGYGTENGADYWIVKNSWGPIWGEKGYIRMSRNKNNQCGIATRASYPLP